MTQFIVHNIHGKIQRTGNCPLGMVNMQVGPDEFVIEGEADDTKHKIVDGKLIDKTPAEILANNPPPPIIADEDKPAKITRGQLKQMLARITTLENIWSTVN